MQHSICSGLHLKEVLNSKRLPFTFCLKTRNTDLQLTNESRKILGIKGRAMIVKPSGIQKLLYTDIAHDMATILTEPKRRFGPPLRRIKAMPFVETHFFQISVLSSRPASQTFTNYLSLSIGDFSNGNLLSTHPERRLYYSIV